MRDQVGFSEVMLEGGSRKTARLGLRKGAFAQRSTERSKPQCFELQKGIAAIKSLATLFRNHARPLRARFDLRHVSQAGDENTFDRSCEESMTYGLISRTTLIRGHGEAKNLKKQLSC